jgi:hypothetical protein
MEGSWAQEQDSRLTGIGIQVVSYLLSCSDWDELQTRIQAASQIFYSGAAFRVLRHHHLPLIPRHPLLLLIFRQVE